MDLENWLHVVQCSSDFEVASDPSEEMGWWWEGE